MQSKLGSALSLKSLFFPRNNHWLKRTALILAFTMFDYFCTLACCRAPYQEANIYARAFMENLGILQGLTLFVILFNLPIYVLLTLDSHIIKFQSKIGNALEILVDLVFAWFVAGLHFGGGTSWFWMAPDTIRQAAGAMLYVAMAVLLVKPHRPKYQSA